ncbi:Uncharacterised protein [Achromobacter xylosoxidans]|nr:Uncharacterised protein [Achromobacter xylosoxidans]SQG75619.1 Uncharacterised protein [Achromobacter xylosoxidans]
MGPIWGQYGADRLLGVSCVIPTPVVAARSAEILDLIQYGSTLSNRFDMRFIELDRHFSGGSVCTHLVSAIEHRIGQLGRTIDQLTITSVTASGSDDAYLSIEKAARALGKSASGSWIGYHARVYWKNFDVPPPSVHFSIEQGLRENPFNPAHANWVQYESAEVRAAILGDDGEATLQRARTTSEQLTQAFDKAKNEVLAVIATLQGMHSTPLVEGIGEDVDKLTVSSLLEIVDSHSPRRRYVTSDTLAMNHGTVAPAPVPSSVDSPRRRPR